MEKNARIYVAGHTGMVGSAIVRKLEVEGYQNLILRTRKELNLFDQTSVRKFFIDGKPEYVFDTAARVGGINANNTFRAQFIYENLQIQNNIIQGAYEFGVKKLLFLGSSCIYPRNATQPMKEEYLLTGELEPTNEPYALAKIAGIKMCESYYQQYGCQFFSLMPTNAYGSNDNYDLETSHVLPALIRKIHEAKLNDAKEVTVWGTGNALREFIYVDDIASATVFVMGCDFPSLYGAGLVHLNIGTGNEITVSELAKLICGIVGFSGELVFDESMPDGTPRKLLDVSRINDLGWQHSVSLKEGIKATYNWYINNYQQPDALLEKHSIILS